MILVTGAAGFIGYSVTRALLARGDTVVGVDNMNAYYDPALKQRRLDQLPDGNFRFIRANIADRSAMEALFAGHAIESIVHCAAQAGVRYSLTHPHAYVESNLTGFVNVLEQARAHPVRHFVYASSSSVYGANTKMPFSEADRVDDPISLYAATKRANELMAEVYARQFGIALTGLRFFTVYGPWGRPDMAAMKFLDALVSGAPIEVFNHGDMERDFTFIDDVVDAILRIHDAVPTARNGLSHRLFNIGNHRPVALMRFIEVLAAAAGREPLLKFSPMQPGDVKATFADITAIEREYDWRPSTPVEEGLERLVRWYFEHDWRGPVQASPSM